MNSFKPNGDRSIEYSHPLSFEVLISMQHSKELVMLNIHFENRVQTLEISNVICSIPFPSLYHFHVISIQNNTINWTQSCRSLHWFPHLSLWFSFVMTRWFVHDYPNQFHIVCLFARTTKPWLKWLTINDLYLMTNLCSIVITLDIIMIPTSFIKITMGIGNRSLKTLKNKQWRKHRSDLISSISCIKKRRRMCTNKMFIFSFFSLSKKSKRLWICARIYVRASFLLVVC